MTPYIQRITDSLIGKHRFNESFHRTPHKAIFIESTATTLEVDDVEKMSPGTLGRILCSFEIGDVMARKEELIGGLHFSGDLSAMLRELVSVCLAYAIHDRLDPTMEESHIPHYGKPKHKSGNSVS